MHATLVSETDFGRKVAEKRVTLVDFGAEWCPPCKALLPVMEQLAAQFGERLAVLKVDCDDSPGTAGQFGVMSMPTVIVFKDGVPMEKLVGLRSKAVYEATLSRYL